ncbi:MAG: hypothetical protein PHH88_00780 [Candidatus Pacebacteria bacterium]|nr:hypothetical protein [Candidatus Paceibacterota bacterium]MDD4333685.1 hypothetical protein [Candidatus Paceibacterota bacterium]
MEDIIISLNASNIIVNLFFVIIVFIIGAFLAKKFGKATEKLLINIRLDQAIKNLGWQQFFEKYKANVKVSNFLGIIIEFYILLITLMVSSEILNFPVLTNFFLNIVEYYPNILISMVIFVIAVFVAEFSKKIIYLDSKDKYSSSLGSFIASATWILAILAILYQLNIVPELVIVLFMGATITLVLIVGLSFGLGGQEIVKKFLKKFEKKIK